MYSTKPYLVRAIFDWCIDESLTPHLLVELSDQVKVPNRHNKNNEIILNISPASVTKLVIDNDFISFSARFSGIHEDIMVPMGFVKSVYALENGEGLHFIIDNKTKKREIDNIQSVGSKELKKSHLKLVE